MNFWIDVLPPLIGAVLLWWGATGIIIYVCRRKAWRPYVFGFVTLIQPLAFWQLWATRHSNEVSGVFASFFWAVIIWGWLETSYYSGFVVGLKNLPEVTPDMPTGKRFKLAVAANLYHEISIIGLSIAVALAGAGGVNEVGLWTFMILHWTHQSAKLNIFFGVNNLTTDYLPLNLRYMAQYFVKKPLNSFFPFSVTVSIIIATFLLLSAVNAPTAGTVTGQALLFILMTAAVLEHWWLVTPIPPKVWNWAIKNHEKMADDGMAIKSSHPEVTILCGYLGSGKTTIIRNLLPQLSGRVAVIVNDFGAVGVDAELIRGDGKAGAVVELPGGCVCCTLQKNLNGQILQLLDEYEPERIIIEPSGVAGIEEIVKTLASPRLIHRLGTINVVAVVESPRLLTPGTLPGFTLTQIKAAQAVIISKIDLVEQVHLEGITRLVQAVNGHAACFTATNGQVSADSLFAALAAHAGHNHHEPDHVHESAEEHHHHHQEVEGGLITFGQEYPGVFESSAIARLFSAMAAGQFGGTVERAKGIFRVQFGREAWDLANGRVTRRVLPPAEFETESSSRLMVIARDLATAELEAQVTRCLVDNGQWVVGSEPKAER
jgi:putative photosynthetic complex assembly protein 2